jgi:tricorn protease
MPQTGSFRLDGTNQENLGEAPDIEVKLTPEDWLADRDPQLDKAIEILAPQVESATNAAAEATVD